MKKILAALLLLPSLALAVETDPTCTPSGGSSGDVIQGLSLKVSGNNTTIGSVVHDSSNRSNGTADQTIEGYGTAPIANGMALIVWMKKSDNSGQTELTGFTAPGPHAITSPAIQAMGYQYRYGNYGADSGAITTTGGGNASSTRIDVTLAPGTTLSGLSEGTYCSADNAACTATLPTSYATNDLLLEVCSTSSAAGTISTPSGWTSLKSDTTSGRKLYLFGKIATSGSESAPTWSVSPTVSAQDTNDYTLSYTPSTSATFYAVACKKDQTAPSIAQVKAGNCTGDVAAVAAANEAVTGADTTVLGGSLTYPIHDLYAVLSNGGGDSTLATLADEMLDAPTGYQYDLLASVSATSPCKALNDIPISPTIAAADVTKWPTATSPSSYAFTAGTDCDTSYSDPSGTRQTATLDVYDTSAGEWMSGTTTIYYNNTPPSCSIPNCEYDTGAAFINGVAMDPVAISTWFDDEDTGDTRTITTSSTGTGTGADKIPAGTAIDGSGNWTGTPACASADTSGSFTATATDEAGDTETVDVSWTCYDQVSVPDCDGIDAASCAALAAAVNLDVDATFECSDTVVANGVISQDPAATTVVDPFTSFDITASSGACSGISPWTTVFLDDVTAVPSSAVFVEGAAMSQAGARYVAALPGSGVTFSQRGLKYRGDGALVIEASGAITHYVRGIGLTVDGEVAAAVCSPDYSVAGVPMDPDGTVCMTDIN